MDTNKTKTPKDVKATDLYPGAATDYADSERVNPEMVKRDVKNLNNNPRNNKLDE